MWRFMLGIGVGMVLGHLPAPDWWPMPFWGDVLFITSGAGAWALLDWLDRAAPKS